MGLMSTIIDVTLLVKKAQYLFFFRVLCDVKNDFGLVSLALRAKRIKK